MGLLCYRCWHFRVHLAASFIFNVYCLHHLRILKVHIGFVWMCLQNAVVSFCCVYLLKTCYRRIFLSLLQFFTVFLQNWGYFLLIFHQKCLLQWFLGLWVFFPRVLCHFEYCFLCWTEHLHNYNEDCVAILFCKILKFGLDKISWYH